MMTSRIKFIIESELGQVPLAGVSIRALCEHFRLPRDLAYQIELCVVEILNNVIEYGYGMQKGNPIEVRCRFEQSSVRIAVVDQARPMESFEIPQVDYNPHDVENLPERGFGLFLVHEIMDEVTYETQRKNNRVVMVKSWALPVSGEIG